MTNRAAMVVIWSDAQHGYGGREYQGADAKHHHRRAGARAGVGPDRASAIPTFRRMPHLQPARPEVARRIAEIEDAGVVEVVVFHSSADRLRRYQADLPFALVADP
jgi:hypothetical protein